jgi:TonB-linked SusC/RagA family outer membrane protein
MKKLMLLLTLFAFIGMTAFAQRTVTGTVTDDSGAPMPGVAVSVKATTVGTMTQPDGTYSLEVPEGSDVLVFSYIGMRTEEVEITGDVVNVAMEPSDQMVDEVIITGYGTRSKGAVSGSVSSVGSEKLESIPVASFENLLQGQVPGLISVSSSGAPGSAATVRIRGINSINAGNSPLYVIDGVPVAEGGFSTLNPNDIEQISVLKDASLTTIYGARASNGVIVVTTKRGKKSDRTNINFSAQYGVDKVARNKFDMMNTTQKLDYEEELGLRVPGEYNRDSLEQINTDWLDVTLRDAQTQQYQLSLAGGSYKTRFYVSGQYYTQDGILPRSDFERAGLRVNLDHRATDRFNLGATFYAGQEANNLTVSGGDYGNNVYNPVFAARLNNPYEQPYDEDGEFVPNAEFFTGWNAIEQLYLNESSDNQLKLTGNVKGEFTIIDGLTASSRLGVDWYDYTSSSWLNPNSAWGKDPNGEVYRYFSRNKKLLITNMLDYNFKIDNQHSFDLKLGQEAINNYYENFSVTGKGLPNDKVKVLNATAEIDDWTGSIAEYTVSSYFASFSYNYKSRYYMDASYRRDGSSRFGEDTKWGNFWSVGASWNVFNERFMQGVQVIKGLKVSLSTGTVGNYDIGNYAWQSLYNYGGSYNAGNVSAPATDSPGNRMLTWEKLSKTNFNLSFSIYDRANFSIDLYHNVTEDMIFTVPISLTTGWADKISNVGKMQNQGIEVEFDYDIIKTQSFLWNFSTNFAYNKNEVKELYGDVEEIPGNGIITKPGLAYGTFHQVQYAGVNPSNGAPLWYDKDGNVVDYYSEENLVALEGKSYLPPYSGGFTNTFNYRGISLSAQFAWMAQKYLVNNTRYFVESNGQFATYNQTVEMLEYWKEPGDITHNPSPDYATNYFDTRLVEDASFLRLRDLTLSYTLPAAIAQQVKHFQSLRVYVKGRNLYTLTNYKGIDPEYYGVYELNMYPHVKTISFGLELGL